MAFNEEWLNTDRVKATQIRRDRVRKREEKRQGGGSINSREIIKL